MKRNGITQYLGLVLWSVGATLVALKVFGEITWPWWAVTLPMWVGLVLAAAALLVGVVLAGVVCVFARAAKR